MLYEWRCQNPECEAEVEVHRSMRDAELPPINACPQCGAMNWQKILGNFVAVTHTMRDNTFPIKVPGLRKVVKTDRVTGQVLKDHLNRPIVEYRDVVFSSRKQQKQWLKENGMCLTEDGRDPSIGRSQHSHYQQPGNDSTAPSDAAAEMVRGAQFIEPREVYDMFDLDQSSHPSH